MASTAAAVTADWYYDRAGERVGPMSLEELCGLFRARALGLETMVWGEAFRRWVPAGSIAGFRDVCGGEAAAAAAMGGRPGMGGVLDYDAAVDGPVGIGGWLVIPAIGRVCGPVLYAAGAGLYAQYGEVWQARGMMSKNVPVDVMVVVSAVWAVLEVVATVLFFGRKRAAVPAMIGLWVLAVGFAAFSTAMGWNEGKLRMTEGVKWAVGVGPTVVWSGVWIWYFAVSRRVRATFMR